MKIFRPKVYIIFSQSDDLDLHSRSQLRLKLDKCFTCSVIVISRGIQIWHDDRPMHGIYPHARADDLDLDTRSQWVDKGKEIGVDLSQVASNKHSTCYNGRPLLRDLDFENVCMAGPTCVSVLKEQVKLCL